MNIIPLPLLLFEYLEKGVVLEVGWRRGAWPPSLLFVTIKRQARSNSPLPSVGPCHTNQYDLLRFGPAVSLQNTCRQRPDCDGDRPTDTELMAMDEVSVYYLVCPEKHGGRVERKTCHLFLFCETSHSCFYTEVRDHNFQKRKKMLIYAQVNIYEQSRLARLQQICCNSCCSPNDWK